MTLESLFTQCFSGPRYLVSQFSLNWQLSPLETTRTVLTFINSYFTIWLCYKYIFCWENSQTIIRPLNWNLRVFNLVNDPYKNNLQVSFLQSWTTLVETNVKNSCAWLTFLKTNIPLWPIGGEGFLRKNFVSNLSQQLENCWRKFWKMLHNFGKCSAELLKNIKMHINRLYV